MCEKEALGEEEFFEVEKITCEQIGEDGRPWYRVHWVGYGSDDASWEPATGIEHLSIFRQFKATQESKKNKIHSDNDSSRGATKANLRQRRNKIDHYSSSDSNSESDSDSNSDSKSSQPSRNRKKGRIAPLVSLSTKPVKAVIQRNANHINAYHNNHRSSVTHTDNDRRGAIRPLQSKKRSKSQMNGKSNGLHLPSKRRKLNGSSHPTEKIPPKPVPPKPSPPSESQVRSDCCDTIVARKPKLRASRLKKRNSNVRRLPVPQRIATNSDSEDDPIIGTKSLNRNTNNIIQRKKPKPVSNALPQPSYSNRVANHRPTADPKANIPNIRPMPLLHNNSNDATHISTAVENAQQRYKGCAALFLNAIPNKYENNAQQFRIDLESKFGIRIIEIPVLVFSKSHSNSYNDGFCKFAPVANAQHASKAIQLSSSHLLKLDRTNIHATMCDMSRMHGYQWRNHIQLQLQSQTQHSAAMLSPMERRVSQSTHHSTNQSNCHFPNHLRPRPLLKTYPNPRVSESHSNSHLSTDKVRRPASAINPERRTSESHSNSRLPINTPPLPILKRSPKARVSESQRYSVASSSQNTLSQPNFNRNRSDNTPSLHPGFVMKCTQPPPLDSFMTLRLKCNDGSSVIVSTDDIWTAPTHLPTLRVDPPSPPPAPTLRVDTPSPPPAPMEGRESIDEYTAVLESTDNGSDIESLSLSLSPVLSVRSSHGVDIDLDLDIDADTASIELHPISSIATQPDSDAPPQFNYFTIQSEPDLIIIEQTEAANAISNCATIIDMPPLERVDVPTTTHLKLDLCLTTNKSVVSVTTISSAHNCTIGLPFDTARLKQLIYYKHHLSKERKWCETIRQMCVEEYRRNKDGMRGTAEMQWITFNIGECNPRLEEDYISQFFKWCQSQMAFIHSDNNRVIGFTPLVVDILRFNRRLEGILCNIPISTLENREFLNVINRLEAIHRCQRIEIEFLKMDQFKSDFFQSIPSTEPSQNSSPMCAIIQCQIAQTDTRMNRKKLKEICKHLQTPLLAMSDDLILFSASHTELSTVLLSSQLMKQNTVPSLSWATNDRRQRNDNFDKSLKWFSNHINRHTFLNTDLDTVMADALQTYLEKCVLPSMQTIHFICLKLRNKSIKDVNFNDFQQSIISNTHCNNVHISRRHF